jgi:hypothetical protein
MPTQLGSRFGRSEQPAELAQPSSPWLTTTHAAALLHLLRDPLGYPPGEDDAADDGEAQRSGFFVLTRGDTIAAIEPAG